MPTARKEPLHTKKPFHIPGYAGHVAQLRYKCGTRFSPATCKLLADPQVQKSGYTILSCTDGNVRSTEDLLREKRQDIMKSRSASLGDQKFTQPMVPGYTGEVPRMVCQTGKTYEMATFNAITEFENAQRKHRNKVEELRLINAVQYGKNIPQETTSNLPPLLLNRRMPLQRIRRDMKEYSSPANYKLKQNVYQLHNDDRDKRFIAGYMGWVPRTLEMFGKDYENTTHEGLNEFTDGLKNREVVLSTPVTVERKHKKCSDGVKIYPKTAGLIPKYTGHAPGGRYKYGKTYWEMTYNAKDKFAPSMKPWTLQQKTIKQH